MNGIKIGCVVMAAGNSTRYGKNKLLENVEGKTMIEWALDAVPAEEFCKIVVVTQYDEVAELAQKKGFAVIVNPYPEQGLSGTVKLGLNVLQEAEGVLFAVSDQPRLSAGTVRRLCAAFRKAPDRIALLHAKGRRGNPCIFPKAFYPELFELAGDTGGRTVIEHHEDMLTLVPAEEAELMDVDTVPSV